MSLSPVAAHLTGNHIDLAGHVITSRLLINESWLSHGITRRVPGLGKADGNIGYGTPRDRDDAWAMRVEWCRAIGIKAESIVTVHQVHGAAAIPVTLAEAGRGAEPGNGPLAEADILLTDVPGPVLMTLHADCQPILLADPQRRTVAVVHAGWRGTVQDVSGAAVRAMASTFGSSPKDIVAFLGPAICRECYEVGPEVIDAWRALDSDADTDMVSRGSGDRWHFGLEAANHARLRAAGIQADNIEKTAICTRCGGDTLFSHRGQGPDTGRFGAIIAIK